MFKAILIFVLLWSTAMADLTKRNKEIAKVRKELKSLVRKDQRYSKEESVKKAKLYQKLKDLGVPSKFGNYWINTFLKPKSAKPSREDDYKLDAARRKQLRKDLMDYFARNPNFGPEQTRKSGRIPSLEKGKGFVTSAFRPTADKEGHRKYGALDVAAARIGNKEEQQKFIDHFIKLGYTIIDEKFAVSQSRGTGDRGIFHIDKRPGKGRLIHEVPDKPDQVPAGEGRFVGPIIKDRKGNKKFAGNPIGRYTTVKPGEESYGGFIAPVVESPIKRETKQMSVPKSKQKPETERQILDKEIKRKSVIREGEKPLIEDTGDARHAEEVFRRDQQRDLGSVKPAELGAKPPMTKAEVKSLSADEPVELMNKEIQQNRQTPPPEQTENILDVTVSQMGVDPAAAPPVSEPKFEKPTMVAKKGGEVKEYQLGDMVEGPQMLTKGEFGGDIKPRESEVGIEGAPKGVQQEVTQEQIEEVKEKFPEEVDKLASLPSAQEEMQKEAETGLDQDVYQKDTMAIQGHLDDIRSGRNVEQARAALAQYPVEQLAEFRDVRTTPSPAVLGAQTPPDRLELQKAQIQSKQLAAQKAVAPPTAATVAQTMQSQKQEQQGIDRLLQQDFELRKALNEELARAYQAEKDIRKVEPNQFFHSMSTPAKIAASIGMLVAGFGSQTAQGVQSAYNIMNAAIQQDIENQKLDREHQLIVAKESRSRAQDAIDKYTKLAMRPETKAKLMELKQKLEQDKNLLEAAKQKEQTKRFLLDGISSGRIATLKPWMRDFLYNKSQQSEQFKLRSDFDKEIKDTNAQPIVSAYRKLESLVNNNPEPGGQGDIAIVFSFMKMLDPNSVVREGEFQTAENATPRAVQFARTWNKFFNGGRFIEADRKKFLQVTKLLVAPALADLEFVKQRYVKISQRYGYPPSLIVGPTISMKDIPGGKREIRIQKRMKKDGLTRKEAEAIDKSITKR